MPTPGKDKTNLSGIDNGVEVCAGAPDSDGNGLSDAGGDFCRFDEGGPLVCVENNMPLLYGVSSWSSKCGAEGSPGVYTKIAAVLNWINDV